GKWGTTQHHLAAVAAKNHRHAVHNPLAQFREFMTVDDILAAPPIAWPLTLPMCAPISDGGAALVLCNEPGLRRLPAARARAVRLLASIVQSGTAHDPDQPHLHIGHRAALAAYEQADLGPDEVDVAEVHDATAMGELLNAENLML